MQENQNSPDFGYLFAPPARPGDPGHPRLKVYLRPKPTYRHFDPELVQFTVINPHRSLNGVTESLHVKHPWTGLNTYQVYPDQILIRDRNGREEEAFTFGGELQIESTKEGTLCVVESSAPILHLTNPTGLEQILADEVQVLQAEVRAAWIGEPEMLSQRLANVPPIQLYASCLETMRQRMKHRPGFQGESGQKFTHFVNHEVERLVQAGLLQQPPVPLEELLRR